jgi:hypothetical protein
VKVGAGVGEGGVKMGRGKDGTKILSFSPVLLFLLLLLLLLLLVL